MRRLLKQRAPIPVALIAVCGMLLAACGTGGSSDDAAGAVNAFVAAFEKQDAAAAAAMTTSPSQAEEVIAATLTGMHAENIDAELTGSVEYTDGTASFSLKTVYSWDEDRRFETETNGAVRKLSSGWRIQWEPSVLYPDMPAGGRLQEIRTDATPAPTVDSRSGRVFMKVEPVEQIIIDPTRTSNVANSVRRLAAVLKPIAPLITETVINDKLEADPGEPVVAVTLRKPDVAFLGGDPARIPGVSVHQTEQLLIQDRRLSTPLTAGLTNYWQAIRDATAGWQVQLAGPGMRPRELAGHQGPPGPDIATTIDQNLQLTLGDAVVEVAQPATMLALDATSGAILAMARNSSAADRGINADTGYLVGTSLDPVFTAAERAADPETSAETLLNRLGLGVQLTVPGASTPANGQPGGVAPVDFRPDDYTTTMMNVGALGVALARAQGGDTSSVAPHVIKGVETRVSEGELGSFPAELSGPILQAMRDTAEDGDASGLTGAPGLRALVGTNGPEGPGWFLGIQGGRVLVIYTEGDRSGSAALQVAQKFFRLD